MHRRIDVAERPFIGGDLAVGVHVPLARQQQELFLRELRIDDGQRQCVEGEIPSGVPGILPLVRHGNDVGVVQVRPLAVAAALAFRRRWNLPRIAVDPLRNVEIEELLAPDHAGKGLALYELGVSELDIPLQVGIELIGLGAAQI